VVFVAGKGSLEETAAAVVAVVVVTPALNTELSSEAVGCCSEFDSVDTSSPRSSSSLPNGFRRMS